MADAKEEIEKLYNEVINIKGTSAPKKALLGGTKCPKCGKNVKNNKTSHTVVTSSLKIEGVKNNPFYEKVIKDAGKEPGAYQLEIAYFSCPCGYKYGKVDVIDTMSD